MINEINVTAKISPYSYDDMYSSCSNEGADELKKINGRILVEYRYNGSNLLLKLDNSQLIHISEGDNKINWQLVDNNRGLLPELDFDSYLLIFSEQEKFLWDWKKLFNSFLSKKIALSPSSQYLFLHVEGLPEFILNVAENTAKPKETILYCSES